MNPLERIDLFFLIFIRISAIIFIAPFFGSPNIPNRVKGGISVLLSIMLYPSISTKIPEQEATSLISLIIGISREIILGAWIGLVITMIFEAVRLAGQLIGFQMGFGIVNIIDPDSEVQYSPIAQFKNIIALLIFLSIDGHHMIIKALIDSFKTLPIFGFSITGRSIEHIIRLSGEMFSISVRIGAPVISILLLSNIALGLLARAIPQLNVFIAGFPVQIAAGLLGLGITTPFFVQFLHDLFQDMAKGLNFVFM
jgi:flagellar biosynthetic protein FliR